MTSNRRNSASRGAGFTLVEMLVVIVIIGMLAGLTTSVLVGARRSVRNSVVSSEMAQLSMALDNYKNKYGEYPPDFSDEAAVMRHVKKRWPRYNVASYADFMEHVQNGCKLSSGIYTGTVSNLSELNGKHVWQLERYVSSLIFWLGGLPNEDGIPSGFYANPKAPLGIDVSNNPIHKPLRATREKPLFSFSRKNLTTFAFSGASGPSGGSTNDSVFHPSEDVWNDAMGANYYIPAITQGGYPILYFRPSPGSGYDGKYVFFGETPVEGVSQAVPYARNWDEKKRRWNWYEERRFQLVHPGADGLFGLSEAEGGREGAIPVATQPTQNCTLADDDNITNFLETGTLQSEYKDVPGD